MISVLKKYWWVLLMLVVVILIFFLNYDENHIKDFEWKNNPEKILGELAVGLLLVGALLDQFITVFFAENNDSQEIRKETETTLSFFRERRRIIRRDILQEQLTADTGARAANITRLNSELANSEGSIKRAEEIMTTVNSERTTYVRMVAFSIGLILAVTGIKTLTPFISMSSIESNISTKLLYFCDLLFTAALLSGGTTGISQFLKVIKDSWKRNG
ncbi:hypothetical protein IWQ47_001178 [Aquimarina sp. EL_43]|uniref:hypothetical protein n=1 Tax=unclassified Aquimarina TaxID=2627091 RepID=UPI0018CB8697|nr:MULTISPECIES: hypothetical protein [unclassified Aquimarina]MBG6129519.1 hypothetical protein [Aquimarina sp. EL_35]MBG6150584.1 hypothetical protein [Aquimarina sp. EL_32]MBG6168108.1 hypothetical protein [Aquimarina sp. EL_43]